MGSFRSKPAVEKDVESGMDQHGRAYVCGSMQGWRIDQEDAHLIVTKEKQYAIYGVFDGHGGPEVSALVAKHLLQFLQKHPKWDSDKEAAVCGAFKELDQFIKSAAGQREMRAFLHLTPESVAPMEEKEVDMLQQEAAMPVEDLVEAELRRHREETRDTMETASTNTSTTGTITASGGVLETATVEAKAPSLLSEESNSAMDMAGFQALRGSGNQDKDTAGGGDCNSSSDGSDRGAADSDSGLPAKRAKTTDRQADKHSAQSNSDDVGGDTEDDDDDGDVEYVPGQKGKRSHESEGEEGEGGRVHDDDDEEEDEDSGEGERSDSQTAADALFASTESGFSSGTTANVVIMDKSNVLVANAGDCRTVVCRAGEAVELSIDHKPTDEPERSRVLKAGSQVTANGRIDGGLNLSRALGDWRYKQCSTASHEEQAVSYVPDFKSLQLKPEDEFLVVACDGVWNTMESQEVVDFVRQRLAGAVRLKDIMTQLLDTCMAPTLYSETGAGCDNETAIIVVLKDIASATVTPIAPPRSFFGEDTAPRFLQSSMHRLPSAHAEEKGDEDENEGEVGSEGDTSAAAKSSKRKKKKRRKAVVKGTAGVVERDERGADEGQWAAGATTDSSAREEQRRNKRRKQNEPSGGAASSSSSSPFMVLDPILQDPVSESGEDSHAGDADAGEGRHHRNGTAGEDRSPNSKRKKRGAPDDGLQSPVAGRLGLGTGRPPRKALSTGQQEKGKDDGGELGTADSSSVLSIGHMDDISGGASAQEEPMVVDTTQGPADEAGTGTVTSTDSAANDTKGTDDDATQALDPRYAIDTKFPHAEYLQDVQDIVKLSDLSYTETTSL